MCSDYNDRANNDINRNDNETWKLTQQVKKGLKKASGEQKVYYRAKNTIN